MEKNTGFLSYLKKAVEEYSEAKKLEKQEAKKAKIKVTKDMLSGDSDKQNELADIMPTVENVNKNLRKKISSIGVSREETRILVDNFYQMQDKRIACEAQLRSIIQEADGSISHELLSWNYNQMKIMEDSYFQILDAISKSTRVGRWLREVKGIGPTLAAGLLAYFDIEKASSAGGFWSYAGLNDNLAPKMSRDKAKLIVEDAIKSRDGVLDEVTVAKVAQATGRRTSMLLTKSTNSKGKIVKDDLIKAVSYMPYNKSLKVLCWKCGHQFALLQNRDSSLYGRILKERKIYETLKNENGDYANEAKKILGQDYVYDPEEYCVVDEEDQDFYKRSASILHTKKYGKDTDAYKALNQGMLPKAQIQARAERYAVKLFISHLFEMMYEDKYGEKAPNPYVIAFMDHVDYVGPEVPYDFDKK